MGWNSSWLHKQLIYNIKSKTKTDIWREAFLLADSVRWP